ncbi:winged helix-turn-helix domain-containing protein, partial [Candidatus Woesearchaeota archaeon]|nr:winged helix-turn-helix domain-containing protein [Candidatus Woesearchaeota archaeon]
QRTPENKWVCELITEPIKSGYESNVELQLVVQDTAGNPAEWLSEPVHTKSGSKGDYKIDILGLTSEDKPDYWQVKKVIPMGGESAFVDLDVALLTYSRIPFEVRLSPSKGDVKALKIEFVNCVPKEIISNKNANETMVESQVPVLSRGLLYYGVSVVGDSSPKPKVMLEFEPFDGIKMWGLTESKGEFSTKIVEYKCMLKIYSEVGTSAIKAGELQEFTAKVPFGFSSLGAPDKNLDEIIEKEKHAVKTGFWGAIGKLAKILKYIDYLIQGVRLFIGASAMFNNVKDAFTPMEAYPVTKPEAVFSCWGLNSGVQGLDLGSQVLNVPLKILSCDTSTKADLGWYDKWASYLPDLYNDLMNIKIGRSFGNKCTIKDPTTGKEVNQCTFKPVHSIKDNLYLSIAGLCVPGIIQNLDKYRQIKCRKISCLQHDVKAGLATVSQCSELEGLLVCKYFVGELWYILPFSQFWDKVIGALREALKDPIAIAHTATILGCGIPCSASNKVQVSNKVVQLSIIPKQKVLEFFFENPNLKPTVRNLAQKLKLSHSTLQVHLVELRKKGMITKENQWIDREHNRLLKSNYYMEKFSKCGLFD